MGLSTTQPALAQQAGGETAAVAQSDQIGFEADSLEYAQDSDVVTAKGNVVLRRDNKSVRADQVLWNRKSGEIVATGNIRMVDEDGNQLFTDRVELTDEFKTGAMENMLLALREGGRLAALSGKRVENGNILLSNAAYTGCDVEDEHGCPKAPSWRITAREVVYMPDKKTVHFRGARMELFGMRLMPLPGISIATDGRAISGLLIPNFRLSPSNGGEISETWYQRLSDNRDISVTAYAFTAAPPMLSAQYRALTDRGAYQITGYATTSTVIPVSANASGSEKEFRGYIFANGRYQLSPEWSITGSARRATDSTFLNRYNISYDDILRSNVNVERISPNSYLSIEGWAFQTLRAGDVQGQVPIALPAIDFRRRFSGLLGGQLQVQANSLNIMRSAGQDTQRAFVSAQWDLNRVTGMGQLVTLTGLVRGDVYHSSDNALTTTVSYQGTPGWQSRAIATGALDVKWPFFGNFLTGTQVLTPHLQIVATPSVRNVVVPNEDSRAIDLQEGNLFALNRFPGYDRVEDGTRFTYGLEWQFDAPRWRIRASVGQSYRLSSKDSILPSGTGLSDRVSDIVGRTEVQYRNFIKLTHRYRIDKSSFAFRRNEFDATIGNQRTYIELGYSMLNRNISNAIEDLKDSEELRAAGRVAFARYWSLFGAGVFNLGESSNQTQIVASGFQPLRTRLGLAYQDDCLEMGLTWRRDYVTVGDVTRGNSFEFRIAFRNLGVR